MAIETHTAVIKLMSVNQLGAVVDKNDLSLKEVATVDTEPRIIEDEAIPNSSGNPTISEYIQLEAGDDYRLMHLDQTYIITQLIV